MKIELKNIFHTFQHREDLETFTTNLYINSVHAGYNYNLDCSAWCNESNYT